MRTTLGFCVAALLAVTAAGSGPERVLELAPSAGNPRNSEGDFVALKDGRLFFVYTHYTGGFDDDATAHLAGRFSSDGGRTWTPESVTVLPNEGKQNVMSVSLLRLQDGRIGLFYLRKNSTSDCRAYLRFSEDEGQTWSEPTLCIPDEGYFVVNNDRVVQLKSGRLVVPAASHTFYRKEFLARGAAMCYLSDDGGKTWRRSETVVEGPAESRSGLQEPGVVELKDGRLLMLCRTDQGCQMRAWSSDGGSTWSPAERTELLSPVSPATFEIIPSTGDLLLVWNDHRGIDEARRGKRTPLSVALSRDEGRSWEQAKVLEDDPQGWYCYTAMEFTEDAVLLGYCAGNTPTENGLARTRITRIPLDWLYPLAEQALP